MIKFTLIRLSRPNGIQFQIVLLLSSWFIQPLTGQVENTDLDVEFFVRHMRTAQVRPIEKCDAHNKIMLIRNYNVTLSKLVNSDSHLWCKHARKLFVFGSQFINIDRDLNAEYDGLSATMVAKNWIISGNRTVNLSGANGASWPRIIDENGDQNNETSGIDGKPGKTGGNGGNFIGICDKIIKEPVGSSLTINLSGGYGGDGESGGNGKDGNDGEDRNEDYLPSAYSPLFDIVKTLPSNQTIVINLNSGVCGGAGGNGGDGGAGGFGGNAGSAHITVTNGDRSSLTVLSKTGSNGKSGVGGRGGKGGKHGMGAQCTLHRLFWNMIRAWGNCKAVPVMTCDGGAPFADDGEDGKTGGNSAGLIVRLKPGLLEDEFMSSMEMFKS